MSRGLIDRVLAKLVDQTPKWGSWQAIGNNWLAPSDGLVKLTCTSSGGGNWCYTSVGNICMQGGLTQQACFPIKKGETFKYTNYADGNRVGAWFIPLNLGGGRNLPTYAAYAPCREAVAA